MKNIKAVIQQIAPTLASALDGPFSGVASKFIIDKLAGTSDTSGKTSQEIISELLNNSENLVKIKEVDQQFKSEMEKLEVDVFTLETVNSNPQQSNSTTDLKPQIIISLLFLTAYFLMLVAIFFVEVSDSTNMLKGENSLMGELQILFGVLTAGVGQILSFWFGGVFKKNASNANE